MSQQPTPNPATEHLVEHAAFLARVSARLAMDASAADDVAQQTWLSMMEHPPMRAPTRGWVAVVARTFARRFGRDERRRSRHERAAARRVAEPSVADLFDRAQLRQRLGELVLRLEEPYASTLLLRFYEDLKPGRIAAVQGVPVETVRTRIRRGLKRLREQLDDEQDRAQWMAALLPIGRWAGAGVPGRIGRPAPPPVLTASAVAGVLVVAVALSLIVPISKERGEGRVATAATVEPASPSDRGPEPGSPPPGTPADGGIVLSSRPFAAPGAGVVPAASPDTDDPEAGVPVRVETVGGVPVAGTRVVWMIDGYDHERHSGQRTPVPGPGGLTGATGRATLPPPPDGDVIIHTRSSEWFVVGRADTATAGDGRVLVVAPARARTGVVVDAEGRPLRALVAFQPDTAFLAALEASSGKRRWQADDRSSEDWRSASTATDAEGRFRLVIPDLPGAVRLRAWAAEHLDHDGPPPLTDDARIVLHRDASRGEVPVVLVGSVRSPAGVAVAGAVVGFGAHETTTDAAGRYVMAVSAGSGGGYDLSARDGDRIGGTLGFQDRLATCTAGDEVAADLVVRAYHGVIAGRVIDGASRPLPGVVVRLVERQGLLMLNEVTPQVTGPDGTFRFDALADGVARIEVETAGDVSLGYARSAMVATGGPPAVVRVDVQDPIRRLAVKVLDAHGRPVHGATLRLALPGRARGRRLARTGADGVCRLESLPRHGSLEVVDTAPGSSFVGRRITLEGVSDDQELTVEVSPPHRVLLHPGDRNRSAARVTVRDRDGIPLLFITHRYGLALLADHWSLPEERALVIDVPDEARTLVLEALDGRVVGRHPLAPLSRSTQEVRP